MPKVHLLIRYILGMLSLINMPNLCLLCIYAVPVFFFHEKINCLKACLSCTYFFNRYIIGMPKVCKIGTVNKYWFQSCIH